VITAPYYFCAYVPLLLSQYRDSDRNIWAGMEEGDEDSWFFEPIMSKPKATKDFSIDIRCGCARARRCVCVRVWVGAGV
jgi:hypothetical protein